MLVTKQGRWGEVTFFAKDEYVGRSLYNYGEYNPDETEKILELATIKNGVCLDIGANCGVITQALICDGFIVKAFEPQPEVFKVLEMNIAHSNKFCGYDDSLTNAYNCGLGAENTMAVMPKVHYSEKGNFGGMSIGSRSLMGTINVLVQTLDSFNFKHIGFIKLDVEGYELQVLQGGTKTILRDKPIMYIEDDRSEKSWELREYIKQLGYSIEEHKPTLYREKNFFGLKKNIWTPHNFASHNLICIPL